MPRRALTLLCLAACAAPPAPAPAQVSERGADVPAPRDIPPVPKASEPVPPASPRLLSAEVIEFGVLADGTVLLRPVSTSDPPPDGLEVLDPGTGARRPWLASWQPVGWKLRRGSETSLIDFEVSRDGRRVVLAYSFEVRRNPILTRPELYAFIVARGDGSDPRCVGIGIPGDDPPPHTFGSDGRLIGDWTVQCLPGPRGVPLALNPGTDLEAWPRLQQWYDPDDGRRGVVPGPGPWWYERDPLGDIVAMQETGDVRELEFRNFATGARVGAVALGDGPSLRTLAWVSADMLLVEHLVSDPQPQQHALVTTDGRVFPAPHTNWRVYTRLPDGTHLFSRDAGATVEHGRVDWPRFTVLTSQRRPDLETFTMPAAAGELRQDATWTPGLGGVLIHDQNSGSLYLAGL